MKVYLDNAATTAMSKEVLDEMLPFFSEVYGNPSSVHSFGQASKNAIDIARSRVASALGAKPNEIIFTGSGTESDNMAIFGVASKLKKKGNHIITTAIEHHAVLHACNKLERDGFDITYLPVDEFGMVSSKQVENAITDKTILVTIMYANNEVGTIMPIKEIGAVCKANGVIFHTDAVQAIGHIPIDVNEQNIDLLSLSAHKLHGPKGVGALYMKKGINLPPYIYGGAQELKRRAGTENVAGIVGLGKAIEIASSNDNTAKLTAMRDRLIKGIIDTIPEVKLNGHPTKRLPNNVNVSIKYIEGESILLMLDINGIAASSGSACTSGSLDPSHVLLAMGMSHETAHGSVRLTLSESTTDEEIDYTIKTLGTITQRLRAMSPLYNPTDRSFLRSEGSHTH